MTVHVRKQSDIHDKNHTCQPSISRTHVNAAWTEELIVGHWSKTNEVTDFIIRRKMQWLLMNGCEYKSPISTVTEFLNSCHDGTSASAAWRLHWKVIELPWNKWATFIIVMTRYNFYELEHLTYSISLNQVNTGIKYSYCSYYFWVNTVQWRTVQTAYTHLPANVHAC
jgi:hypothetical protein